VLQTPKFLDALPVPFLGLAFGICALGWNIETFYSLGGYLQMITAAIASLIVVLVSIKLMLSSNSLWQTQRDPAIGPILPTIPMTLMVVSTNLSDQLANALWTFGLCLHLLMLASFIYTRIRYFNLAQVSPAWFIPTIGLAIAPLVNPNEDQLLLNQLIILFCTSVYFLLLPLVAYRLIKLGALPPPNKPVMALFAAPPNLCLVGYLLIIPTPNLNYIFGLTILAISMTLFSYFCILRQLRNPFFPSIGAFTFPLVIGAVAMRTSAEFFEPLTHTYGSLVSLFSALAVVQIIISAIVTLHVCYRYTQNLIAAPQPIKAN
jgi:tellurite resistance protein TehA-like permease